MFAELLVERLASLVDLSATQIEQLETHFNLLTRWNQVLNLTSVRGLEEVVDRHYCESIFLAAQLPLGEQQIVDVGSGAGFPGIPVSIIRPDCAVTLIESHRRKAVFLREASRELRNVRVVAERGENVATRFDWVVSRAVEYSEIEETVGRLADEVALLAGQKHPSNRCFTWNTPLLVPRAKQRFLWIGSRRST